MRQTYLGIDYIIELTVRFCQRVKLDVKLLWMESGTISVYPIIDYGFYTTLLDRNKSCVCIRVYEYNRIHEH